MEDGRDRARRDYAGGSGGRRAAVRDGDERADDVLARFGLLEPEAGGRRRRPDDAAGPPPAAANGSPRRHRAPDDSPVERTGGRRRRPEPDEPRPPAPEADGGRRRRADGPAIEATGGRRRADAPPVAGGGRRRAPDTDEPRSAVETTGGRRRRPEVDSWPATEDRPAGRRRAPEPDTARPVESTGGRRRRDDAAPPVESTGGRRRRPEPVDDGPQPGGRRRRPEAPPARHAPPGPHVDDLGGRGAGGTGNFLDESTARGRAALESSGALQRTQAVSPGWVRANDRSNGAEATTRLSARTSRHTAPNAKVPPAGRRAAFADPATTALPARRREQPDGPGADRRSRPEPSADDRENGAQRVARIDETLTRLTAAHAGLALISDRHLEQDDEPLPRPRFTPLRLLCLALVVVVLGAAGAGYATRAWLGKVVPTVSALDTRSSAVVDAAAQAGSKNVLVVAGERETIPGTGSNDATTFAIAHVPAGGGSVTVLSLPSTLEINRPPCERFDPISREYTTQLVPAEKGTKLASALGVGGPRCATRVVQQLTGLSITSYVGIDLDELARLVDAVGGVGLCLTRPVVDQSLGPIVAQPGTQRLGGDHTLDYLRAREVAGDPASGAGRVERQQGVLAAALAPLLSTTGLLDIGRLMAARPVLGRALTVDGLDLDQVHATARTLHKLDADGVRFVAAPTMAGPSGSALVLRDAEAADLFTAIRTGKPLPAASDAAAGAGPQPGDVPVQVLNASDRAGLANQIAETLKQLGFGVGDTGNAAQRTSQTIIRFSPDREAAAKLLAGSVPSATTVPDPGSTGVLQLVLGRSFDDVVRPPTSAVPDTDGAQAATGSSQCS
ncbi:LCP family protein [Pseudonocardia sp. CA-107938]|uniref:LCP family protein n=1 Tax=Pseudonocardia sp. CA-107938 TaxID=3240021 RepID=UPI003D91A6A7